MFGVTGDLQGGPHHTAVALATLPNSSLLRKVSEVILYSFQDRRW